MTEITVIEPLPKPLPANPALVTRWPIGRQVVHAQARFLGYRATLEAHPTETLWLCAAQRDGVERRRDAVADAASLILPITLATYEQTLDTLVVRLREWDERGVGRLSLPETLYTERPEEGTAKVGSHSKNGGILPPTGRLLWADIDTDTGHGTPEGAPYPLPTPEEGRRIAERIESDFGHAAVLVESGSGGFQVYLRVTGAVTDEDFKGYLTALEEQYGRYIDRSVVGRHGPIRVWGHNRAGKGVVKAHGIHVAEDGDRPVIDRMPPLTDGSLTIGSSLGLPGWRERYTARVGADAAKKAQRAVATTTARARVDVKAEGDSPRTRMDRAVPASAYVEAVHDGAVEGDHIRLRQDADITVFTHEDGTEFVTTFSPTTMATLGLEPGEKGAASATTYGLLAAVVGKDGAWRIACHFDGRFDGLLPWVAENLGDLAAATAALPAPKGNPAATKKRMKNADLVAAFDSAFTVTEVGGDPRKHRRASQVIRYRARSLKADPTAVMKDLIDERLGKR